jgi:hypothetical protein
MAGPFDPGKELRLLLAFFGDAELPKSEVVPPASIPSPYRELLVHNGHMTETLERYYEVPVDVHPYAVHRSGRMYGRKLDLTVGPEGRVVMTGAMLFNLNAVDEAVQAEILAAQVPLGRILIQHGVLREVAAETFLKILPDDPFVARFRLQAPAPAYGRLATIFCEDKPAVDLLEIVRP